MDCGAAVKQSEPRLAFPRPASVVSAVSKAKATLSRFQAAVQARRAGAFYGVKLHFPRLDGSEGYHIWLTVTEYFAELYFCTPVELPSDLVGLSMGESKLATENDIEDWMVMDGGVLYGGYSLRAIRAELPTDEQMRYDSHMGSFSMPTKTPNCPHGLRT